MILKQCLRPPFLLLNRCFARCQLFGKVRLMLLFGEHLFHGGLTDLYPHGGLFCGFAGNPARFRARFFIPAWPTTFPCCRFFRQRPPDLERNPDALVNGFNFLISQT